MELHNPPEFNPKVGDRVLYANDDTDTVWTVARMGDSFAALTDNIREYPKSHFFHVPLATLLPRDSIRPNRPVLPASNVAPPKAPKASNQKVEFEVPPKTLDEFIAAAGARGATGRQIDELHEIWAQPAPNGGVRVMRMRNFFKHYLSGK